MNAVFWSNLVGYQLTWFAVAWSAGQGRVWIGMLASVAFIAWQLGTSPVRGADLRALLCALVCSLLIDGAAAGSGLIVYAAPTPAMPAPTWIVLLWGAFALTLNHSMAWFADRPWTATAFAAVGGPLAYLGAARGFAALTFADPVWPGLLWLALAWAIALPLLLNIAALRSVADVQVKI